MDGSRLSTYTLVTAKFNRDAKNTTGSSTVGPPPLTSRSTPPWQRAHSPTYRRPTPPARGYREHFTMSKGPPAPYKRHCFYPTTTLQPGQDEPSSEAETEMAVASGELALDQQPGPAPRGVWAGCRGDARHTQGRIDGGGGNRRGGKGKRSLGKTGGFRTGAPLLPSFQSSPARRDEKFTLAVTMPVTR